MEETGTKGPVDQPVVVDPFAHPLMSSLKRHGDLERLRVTVIFECEGCCLKALNGKVAEIVDGFLVLVARDDSFILVKLTSGGKLVDKEVVKALIIPLDRICAVEIGAVEVDA